MVFIIGVICGSFIGWKMKGAIVFIKQAKDVKYIKSIVETILSKDEIKLYKSLQEIKEAREESSLKDELLRMKVQG